MTAKEPTLEPLALPVEWDTGAPIPILVQDGSQSAVCFYAARASSPSPVWEAQLVDPAVTIREIGVIHFTGCYASMVSMYGWDEAREHPLWSLGLARFPRHRAFEIVASHWASKYRGFRGDRPLRHIALLFPDTTLEFLAEEFTAHVESGSVHAVTKRQLRAWGDGAA